MGGEQVVLRVDKLSVQSIYSMPIAAVRTLGSLGAWCVHMYSSCGMK